MSVEPILQARSLVKRYGRVTALDHADFDLYPGEILAVIGDNGAGKSSLIKALSGALVPDEGDLLLDGKPVKFRSRRKFFKFLCRESARVQNHLYRFIKAVFPIELALIDSALYELENLRLPKMKVRDL